MAPDGAAPGDGFRVPGPDEPAGVMRYSGAGLGLSIVAGIVSAHQGTVTVENVDGGCRFSLLLPGQGAAGQEPGGSHGTAAGGASAPAAAAQGTRNRIPRDAVEEKLRTGRAQ
jgi:hypothetical protein